jgi:undecaprenyl-diphosphatase
VFATITGWILHLHGWLALAIVFAVPALEASAFVGFVFPGEIAALLGGVLASQSRVSLAGVLAAATAGAVLGDSIGYSVGRRWGRGMLHGSVGRLVNRRHLDRAEAYLAARGGKAVFLGRFTAALRVLIPGLAGMSRMRYGTFAIYNMAGAIVWATVTVLTGYVAGTSWRHAERVASRVGLGLLAAVLIGFTAAWALRRLGRRSAPVHAVLDRLAAWPPAERLRRRFPAQAAWLADRLDPAAPSGLPLTLTVSAGAACTWAFAAITEDVLTNDETARLDPVVQQFVVAHRTAWLTHAMRAATLLGSSIVLIPLLTLTGLALARRTRSWWPGIQLAAASLGALALVNAAKALVDRPRPPDSLAGHPFGSSFPSGHSAQGVAAWGMLAIVLTGGCRLRTRVYAATAAAAVALSVGASRIYLGVHWLTDVLGGYALAGAWLAVVLAVRLRHGRISAIAPSTEIGRDP